MKYTLALLLTVFLTIAHATDPYPRQEAVDVQRYSFRITLNDSTNIIRGEAQITILFKKATDTFFLDLAEKSPQGRGMTVSEVTMDEKSINYKHTGGRLTLTLPAATTVGQVKTVRVRYAGEPEDGILIGKNRYGDRTYFADHWPDRGHYWLPCIDHPSDKATMEFIIVAPEKYQVVASGVKKEETNLEKGMKLTRYVESVPIAMKVTAVGVARFATEEKAIVDQIPQSIWVYPQDRDAGFSDFAVGVQVFEYFNKNIGPYPYEKLAHVQSLTRWGGLENAGNIFYRESAVTGKNNIEELIAHESAHQWFGNSVTERDWHHVWVSEGFATYFALLFLEQAHGPAPMKAELAKDRDQVVKYFKTNPKPILDTTITEIRKVLSTNTYQKASWVLHMLRQVVGDEAFWNGIRTYYKTYRDQNVLTADFQKVMENASGKNLGDFFRQWLYTPGQPKILVTWTYDKAKSTVNVSVKQEQPIPFRFPLDIRLQMEDGTVVDQTLDITASAGQFTLASKGRPTALDLDPNCRLLFEGTAKGK